MVDPHPVVRRTRSEVAVGQESAQQLVSAIRKRIDGDLGVSALAAHLLGALQGPIDEPGRDRLLRGRDFDLDDLAVALAGRHRVADRPAVGRQDEKAVLRQLETGLGETFNDVCRRVIGKPDQRRVVRRRELEDALGIGRHWRPDGIPVR